MWAILPVETDFQVLYITANVTVYSAGNCWCYKHGKDLLTWLNPKPPSNLGMLGFLDNSDEVQK